jgi:predicted MPP superfamily phosphohydrolase
MKRLLRRLRTGRTPQLKNPPHLTFHSVASSRISPELDGLKIAHLSDIHVRAGVRPRRLEAAVEMVNAQKPDLVALTGDYVCISNRPLPALTEALRALKVPAYATLGNHDHWSGARAVEKALQKAGVDVLRNQSRAVQTARGLVHLVGIDDSVTRHHDPERAFAGVPPSATTIALSHDPNSADFLHPYGPALILSGHTHGGQLFFRRLTPFLTSKMGVKYLAGFFDVNGSMLYVNRGLGAALPLRYRTPMEVALLTLRAKATNSLAA